MATDNNLIIEDVGVKYNVDNIKTWSFNETLLGNAIILCIYLMLVVKILPAFMNNRKPLKINNLLMVYNAFQVVLSMYLVFIYLTYIIKHGVIVTRCPKGETMNDVSFKSFVTFLVIVKIFPYFIAKHFDLLDTVFFVLRKKENQVTFLHLYHHATMITWIWFYLVYYPTDHFVIVGLLNSLVHVLMYAYYGISTLGPKYAKFVWWKKHLTKLQLIQFILAILNLHYQQKLSPCPVPALFHYYCVAVMCSFFVLFMNFYVSSYWLKNNGWLVKNGSANSNYKAIE